MIGYIRDVQMGHESCKLVNTRIHSCNHIYLRHEVMFSPLFVYLFVCFSFARIDISKSITLMLMYVYGIDQTPTHSIVVGNLMNIRWKSVRKLLRVTEMNEKNAWLHKLSNPYIRQIVNIHKQAEMTKTMDWQFHCL